MNERLFQDRPLHQQVSSKEKAIAWLFAGGLLLAVILLCVGAYGVMNAKDVIVVEATPVPVSANVAMPVSQEFSGEAFAEEFNLVPFAWLVGIGLAAFVFYKVVIETGFWKVLLGLGAAGLLVAGLFWVLLYRGGDVASAEARDANLQVVKVVQPVGDPSLDQTYADVNRQNAGTNIVNAGGNAIYIVLFIVALVVVVGLFVILHYYINR